MKNNFMIKLIAVVLAFIGFFLILGGAGKADCADAVGEHMEMKDFVPQMMIGLLMMTPSWFVFKDPGIKESEDEHGTKAE